MRLPSHDTGTPLTFASASVSGKSQLVVCGAAIITQCAGTGSAGSTACHRQMNNQKRANSIDIAAP